MREVFEADSDKAREAELLLKNDDIVGRQSIAVRNASILGMEGEMVYIIIDGSEEAIKRAEGLLKGFAKKMKKKDELLRKYDGIEDKAAEGFAAIMGD